MALITLEVDKSVSIFFNAMPAMKEIINLSSIRSLILFKTSSALLGFIVKKITSEFLQRSSIV